MNQFTYTISSLFKGKVKVITEKNNYFLNNCIGILSTVGLKNEETNTYGSCEALNLLQRENGELYFNSQLSGGDPFFSFNEESIYTSCACLQNDTEKILQGLLDSIYKPKTNLELNILKHKFQLNKSVKLIQNMNESDQETIMNLIMNKKISNSENIIMPQLNAFIQNKLSKGNVIIVANGINHHHNFVEKAAQLLNQYYKEEKEELNNVNKPNDLKYKALNQYILTDNGQPCNVKLIFPSVGWSSPLMPVLIVIAQIFGSAQMFSVGGPGKGIFSRSYLNILSKKSYINSCSCINFHYSSFGVFGLSFDYIETEKETEVIRDMINELHEFLKPISNEELNRAKFIIKRRILTNLSNSISRCEETAKSLFYFNKIMHTEFIDLIDKVTSDDINNTIKWILNNKASLGLIIKSPRSKKELVANRENIIKLL